VEIYDAVKGVMVILQLYPLLDCSKVISEMEGVTGGLDPRKNSFLTHVRNSRMNYQFREINKRPARLPSIVKTAIRIPFTFTTSPTTGILPKKCMTKPLAVS
jgi:hypothetical protein